MEQRTVVRFFIEREDFEKFRTKLGSQLPPTYDEWFQLSRYDYNQIRKVPQQRVVEKKVDPDEFFVWCATPGGDCTLDGLHRFAGICFERDAH